MSPEETFRRVLAGRLPAGPAWAAWIDGAVAELAAADDARDRLTRIRAVTVAHATDPGAGALLTDVWAVLDAVEAP